MPFLVLFVATILVCLCLFFKKEKTESEHQIELEELPNYSSMDHPPPYSLYDPKLTDIWRRSPPPPYDTCPVMQPNGWRTPRELPPLTPPSAPVSHNHHWNT